MQYVRQISQPVSMMAQQVNTVLAAVAGAERVFEVMAEEPECDEGKVVLVNVAGDQDGNIVETGRPAHGGIGPGKSPTAHWCP